MALVGAALPKPGKRLLPVFGGGAVVSLVPVGSTVAYTADGIMSEAAASQARNMGQWFLFLMGGRVQPAPVWQLAQSGTSIARAVSGNYTWINPIAIDALAAQKPDVAIFGTCGHNDGILNTDPDTDATYLNDWKTALTYFVASNTGALLIPVMGTWPSMLAAETTAIRTKVWTRQQAHAASFADARIVWIDVSTADPANMSPASDSGKVHPDERGGAFGGTLLFNAISPRVATATIDEVMDAIAAATYPGVAAYAESDRALTTTATASTGTGITGNLPNSKVITNTTGATGITVAIASSTGGRNKIAMTLAGTATAAGNIYLTDRNNVTIASATPGQYVASAWRVKSPIGHINFGADTGSLGTAFGTGASLSTNAGYTGQPAAIDGLMFARSQPLFGNASFATKRNIGFRYAAGAMPTTTVEFEQPAIWRVSFRTKHAPVYLGNLVPSGAPATSILVTANYRLRPTGTVSAGAGGTIRVETGHWAPHGLTEADFATRRVYKGTTSDTAVGSGTELTGPGTRLTGSTWTFTVGAGAVATGDLIYVEVDASNGIGGTVTARSVTTITAG